MMYSDPYDDYEGLGMGTAPPVLPSLPVPSGDTKNSGGLWGALANTISDLASKAVEAVTSIAGAQSTKAQVDIDAEIAKAKHQQIVNQNLLNQRAQAGRGVDLVTLAALGGAGYLAWHYLKKKKRRR